MYKRPVRKKFVKISNKRERRQEEPGGIRGGGEGKETLSCDISNFARVSQMPPGMVPLLPNQLLQRLSREMRDDVPTTNATPSDI